MKNQETACFICETPFQLFNALDFALNQREFHFQRMDLYLCSRIKNSSRILEVLQSKRCFDHVYIYSYDFPSGSFTGNLLKKYGPVVFTTAYLLHTTKHMLPRSAITSYTHIFISVLSDFAMALCASNRRAKTLYFDDGLGSYVGKISNQNITWKRRVLYTATGKNYKTLYPQALYVHNVELCHTDWNIPVKPLPKLPAEDDGFWSVIHHIFGDPNPNYLQERIVLLSQPILQACVDGKTDADPILQELASVPFVFRPHPLDFSIPDSLKIIDTTNVLWELICAKCITDEHILIGVCSTAQSSPKIIFGKEPFLIFTFKLYRDISEDYQALYQNLAENIKSTYQNPQKVAIVEDYADFQHTLSNFLHAY